MIDGEDFSSGHGSKVGSDGKSSGFDSKLLSFLEAEVLLKSTHQTYQYRNLLLKLETGAHLVAVMVYDSSNDISHPFFQRVDFVRRVGGEVDDVFLS